VFSSGFPVSGHILSATMEFPRSDEHVDSLPRMITSEELSRHNKAEDLWISIQGKVYNVTDWVKNHPGGDFPLLNLAGQDVTDAFLAFHPGTAWNLLPQFLVGSLSDYEVAPVAEEHRRLLREFKKAGLYKNPLDVYAMYACWVVPLFVLSVLGVLYSKSAMVHMFSAVMLGVVWNQSGWVGHDTGHCGMFKNRNIDRWIALVVGNCLTGISMGWWKRNHNAHHIACNSIEYDPDLQYIPLFAVTSKLFKNLYSYFYDRVMPFDGIARNLVAYQHWTFYPVMAVARVNLFAQSILVLTSKKHVPDRWIEISAIGFFYLWFSTLLSYLPTGQERLAFILVSFAVTGIQHVQFCLNHFSSPVYQGQPKSKAWVESQARGTLNLSTPAYMDWFNGGLQFQIEHHLFPTLPRHNLRKVVKFVRPFCEKYGLPYESVSFWEANRMIISTLRAAALQARDLSKPAPSLSESLLWEAVNSKG
jgi:fatty acid desaturase